MTTIGIISDTHITPGGKRQLPPMVFETFAAVDLILHCGDLNTLQVVRDLEALAPVVAVRGNNDDHEAVLQLPTRRIITIESCHIGMVHGDRGNGRNTPEIALSNFADEENLDAVIFGHSHWPFLEWREHLGAQILLFNPGSASDKRRAPHFSCGLLHVENRKIEAEIITW